MIFLTQLIYVKEGQEDVFHQFEDIAIPAILKYNGRLLLLVRPDENAFIEKGNSMSSIYFGEIFHSKRLKQASGVQQTRGLVALLLEH